MANARKSSISVDLVALAVDAPVLLPVLPLVDLRPLARNLPQVLPRLLARNLPQVHPLQADLLPPLVVLPTSPAVEPDLEPLASVVVEPRALTRVSRFPPART